MRNLLIGLLLAYGMAAVVLNRIAIEYDEMKPEEKEINHKLVDIYCWMMTAKWWFGYSAILVGVICVLMKWVNIW